MRKIFAYMTIWALAGTLNGQSGIIPDSIYVELEITSTTTIDTVSVTPLQIDTTTTIDTGYILVLVEHLPQTGRMKVEPIDFVFTKQGMLGAIKARIGQLEDKQGQADAQTMQYERQNDVYLPANNIFLQYGGRSLVKEFHDSYYREHIGLYLATLGQSSLFVRFYLDGVAVQCTAEGITIPGGMSGNWRAVGANRWRLIEFFPPAIIATDITWTRGLDGKFGAPRYAVRMEKIR